MAETPTMHIDGAARGNPGPAAYAIVLARPGQPVIEKAETMGTATNNVAEYTALVEGLELAAAQGLKRLAVFSDSELLVKQMNGEYRVKHPDLQPLYQEATRLKKRFDAEGIEMPFPHQTVYFGADSRGEAPPAHVLIREPAPDRKPAESEPPARLVKRPEGAQPGFPDVVLPEEGEAASGKE